LHDLTYQAVILVLLLEIEFYFDEQFATEEYALPLEVNVGSSSGVSVFCFDVRIRRGLPQECSEPGAGDFKGRRG
jgi:hypothetical protein